MAKTDALTGLANRTLLNERIHNAIRTETASGNAPAVLILDLDSFKAVNDTLGHSAGDAVLVEVSRRLRSVVRACDTVARLGGDEFAALIIGASADEVMLIAHRAWEALQKVWTSVRKRSGPRPASVFASAARDARQRI